MRKSRRVNHVDASHFLRGCHKNLILVTSTLVRVEVC